MKWTLTVLILIIFLTVWRIRGIGKPLNWIQIPALIHAIKSMPCSPSPAWPCGEMTLWLKRLVPGKKLVKQGVSNVKWSVSRSSQALDQVEGIWLRLGGRVFRHTCDSPKAASFRRGGGRCDVY